MDVLVLWAVIGVTDMAKEFADLSEQAQNAIIDAVLNIDVPQLPEDVKQEIREWAQPVIRWYVLRKTSWGFEEEFASFETKQQAEQYSSKMHGKVRIERRVI